MRIVISGATGLIGRHLVRALAHDDVTVLSRDSEAAKRAVEVARYVSWDGVSNIDAGVFEGVDVVYHLAGEPVAEGRWTSEKKRRVLDSRQRGTRAVVDAIVNAGAKSTLVSASAVGFYGSRGDERLTEDSEAGSGFLPDVCCVWEKEAARAAQSGSRVAMLRIGIVLSPEGGALAKMLPIFRAGLGGRLGSGKQWMPWIHIDDVVALLRHAADTATLEGPINAAAVQPVTNAEFSEALAHALGRHAMLPAPSFALRLVLGELADVVLSSQRVVPGKAVRSGYRFRYPELAGALADLLAPAAHARHQTAT